MSDESGRGTNQCDRCGDEYKSYPVFVEDNFSSITAFLSDNRGYEHLCKPCRVYVLKNTEASGQYFAGANEVDPKTEVR